MEGGIDSAQLATNWHAGAIAPCGYDGASASPEDPNRDTRPFCPVGPGVTAAKNAVVIGTANSLLGGALIYLGTPAAEIGGGGPEDPIGDALAVASYRTGTFLTFTGSATAAGGEAYLAQQGMYRSAFNDFFESMATRKLPDAAAPYVSQGIDAGLNKVEDLLHVPLNSCREQ
jgi:hypothetical protein